MKAMARNLDRLSVLLNSIALWGAVLAVLAMVFAAGWQVLARYVLDAPPIWTEELARRAMVWAGMLGASCAFRAGSDPTLFPSMQSVRGHPGMLLALIRAAAVLIFAAPVIWYSVFNARMDMARGFLGRSLGRQAEMLDIPMIWFTAAVPLAFVLIVIHLAARLAMQASGQLPVAEPANETQ
ncbi:TRAP transporter small permease [Lutimaribacter saemankumensis]|jgi:TRAP-type C4-dicarboxylate transport system permease small subunit|uniref:TRAP transporter small permease protein n=1 Tax=Lutimaribacter saemankumensis TaxID=490829 RepID=A0A1G8RM11_9RHOB|nr:TRAP transporter small permease subunit [Lutimaribacter saemankumensis]SDJ18027.1 TRAP-type C4-dicarboxylate transport system, small permease component [Lutimaribacter saemankumensis]